MFEPSKNLQRRLTAVRSEKQTICQYQY